MSVYQTQGSVAKLAMLVARILEHKGYDPDYAQKFTIMPTEVSCPDQRIVVVIEPQRAPERTPDAKL